jgi:hypothetical protein
MLVQAVYAIFARGLIGAVSQYLRRARPLWTTGLLIRIALPRTMTLAQLGVPHLVKTDIQSGGIFICFYFAGLAAAYSWYAMLGGIDERPQSGTICDLWRASRWISLRPVRDGEASKLK